MSCMGDLVFNPGNNNVVELRSLTNTATGLPDTGAIVTMTIRDRAGTELPGQVWPATLVYVAGTEYDALYRATLDATLEITPGKFYFGTVDVLGTDNVTAQYHPIITVETRRDT